MSQPARISELELNRLIRENQDKLLRYAYRELGNHHDANAAVSLAFEKVWNRERPNNPDGYLWSVIRTCCFDVIRLRVRERMLPQLPTGGAEQDGDREGVDPLTQHAARSPVPLDQLEGREEELVHPVLAEECHERVKSAASPRDRRVLLLKAQGMKHSDIAREVGLKSASRITQIMDAFVAAFLECVRNRYDEIATRKAE